MNKNNYCFACKKFGYTDTGPRLCANCGELDNETDSGDCGACGTGGMQMTCPSCGSIEYHHLDELHYEEDRAEVAQAMVRVERTKERNSTVD